MGVFIYVKTVSLKCVIISLLLTQSLKAADSLEESFKTTHFVIIPGMNGHGGNTAVRDGILNPDLPEHLTKAKIPKPFYADFGQKQCIKQLKESLDPIVNNEGVQEIIIFASSQGTATAFNFIASNPTKIKALVLEAFMASGNSAISHTIKNIMAPNSLALSLCCKLPFSSVWLPYLARLKHPFYYPGGMQPYWSLGNYPTNMLTIIIHSTQDPHLPFEDAKAMYYGLRQRGNDHTYFIAIDSKEHGDLLSLSTTSTEIAAINKIYQIHGLPYNKKYLDDPIFRTISLEKYKPSIEPYKIFFDKLNLKETYIKNIGYILQASILFTCIYIGWSFFDK